MKIALYAPLKPLDHPVPSGDRTIGRSLEAYLKWRGHEVLAPSDFRARHLGRQPWRWPAALLERDRARDNAIGARLWLTYHAYYKAPDVLGPWCAKALGIPYVIFQGVYSTKVKKRLATRIGYELNRRSLLAADYVFTNKRRDEANLLRLLPRERVGYVAPGIAPEAFAFEAKARKRLRAELGLGDWPLVLAAAMFRDDVKTESLVFLLKALGELRRAGRDFALGLCGDGPTRGLLERLAGEELPGRTAFFGLVPRRELRDYLSAADLFAFPGVGEALGMVYLEAQAAGLPVVAFDHLGIPEVVARDETGILTPPGDMAAYARAVDRLLSDREARLAMGRRAEAHVRERHDLTREYAVFEERLTALTAGATRRAGAGRR